MKSSVKWRLLGALSLAGFSLASCGTTTEGEVRPDWLYDNLSVGEIVVAQTAMQQALESRGSNEGHGWESVGGSSGVITPLRTFRITTGHYCRDYLEAVTAPSGNASEMRTACRDSEGTWRRVVKR